VASKQFYPDLDQVRAGTYLGLWRLVTPAHSPLNPDGEKLSRFASAMPPVARAIALDTAVATEATEPARIVESFVSVIADAFIRRAVSTDEFFTRVHSLAAQTSAAGDVRWLSALLGTDPVLRGGNTESNAYLAEYVRKWVGKLDEGRTSQPWQLVFSLREPALPEVFDEENDATDGGDLVWRLVLQLKAPSSDPDESSAGELIDAADLWDTSPDAMTAGGLGGGRALAERKAQLTTDLTRAVETCPLLAEFARSDAPAEMNLSTPDANTFIRTWAIALRQAGFGVELPEWAERRERGLGLLLTVSPTDDLNDDDDLPPDADGVPRQGRLSLSGNMEVPSGHFGLESLLEFDWQIAVGDLRLSPAEFKALSQRGSPLVRYKGQWLQIDPDAGQRATAFLAQGGKGKMTLAQALRTAYGINPADTGLPVIGMSGKGWIDNLLSQSPSLKLTGVEQPKSFTGTLRPYQLRGLDWMLFLDRLGLGGCLADDMGLGKAQPLDAKLLTPTGWKTMGEVKVGDLVIGSDGKATRVTGVYPQGEKEVFKVTFSDGSATECCDEHLWYVNTPVRNYRNAPGRVMELRKIRERLRDSSNNSMHFVPLVEAVEFAPPKAPLPLDPYLLGVLLGDGGIAHRCLFSSADAELVQEVESLLPAGVSVRATGHGVDYRIAGDKPGGENPVIEALRRLELFGLRSHEKFVPHCYKFAPTEVRLQVLQGLLDTDGHVRPADNNIEYCTTSLMLARDVQFLIQSLGGTARIREKETTGRLAYRMSVILPGEVAPFRLSRKADVYQPRQKYPPSRAIVDITPVGTKPCQCIAVDAPDHLYVTDDFIVTHNTIQLISLLLAEREKLAATTGIPSNNSHNSSDSDQSQIPNPKSQIPPQSHTTPPRVGPTLLFAPTSVVGNWLKELQRFAPQLKVLVHHGPERHAGDDFVAVANDCDVVITSYALAHRDAADLKRPNWHRIAVDEAQKIKNPSAAATVAIRAIPAPRRIALTGTPIENHLSELWSIMELLNPGLLGTAADFRERFAVPVEKLGDKAKAAMLRKMIQPFVLRRTKNDPAVAGDLPEKMEMKVYCNLTAEQAAMYERVTAEMLGQIDAATGIRRRGLILAALTRLKQICDHPVLVDNDANPSLQAAAGGVGGGGGGAGGGIAFERRSGKCERLLDMLEEVVQEGDAALVFTQYREMGHLLEKMIAERVKAGVQFLHGGTTARQRDAMIEKFQDPNGGIKIFILSLRAGGLGLNLTAANHVFHFDRWWNPAVEQQATDRAHRIGQTRKVQVHQFICVGTLEERIDKLLQDKLMLADQVVGSGDEWLTNLSTEQLRQYLSLGRDAVGEF
jgi:SNF2 family DNA or RNA helicase